MRYEPTQLSDSLWALQSDYVRCFFLKGTERCFLIDTGIGGEGLEEFCRETAGDLPITVLITHGDGDHCGMIPAFSEVYLNPAEYAYCRSHGMELSGVKPVFDGAVFEDGVHRLTAIHIPGHTPGSTAYFDEVTGCLFSGDSFGTAPIYMFRDGRDLQALVCSLKRLLSVPFTTACCCHGEVTLPAEKLPAFLSDCEAMLRGEGTRSPALPHFPKSVYTLTYGSASLYLED